MDRKGMCVEGTPNRGLHGKRTTENKPSTPPSIGNNFAAQATQNAKTQEDVQITDLRGGGKKRYI